MAEDKGKADTLPTTDFYYTLGVKQTATSQEIEEAFGALHYKFGPHTVTDDGPDSVAQKRMYAEMVLAYDTLMDPVQRKDYDQRSSQRQHVDVRSLWNKVTSAAAPQVPQEHDRNAKVQALVLEVPIEITLKEAIKGSHKQLRIADQEPCKECANQKPMMRIKCKNCRGLGFTNFNRTLEIDLPAGTKDGSEVRMPNMGRYDMRAGKNGDLLIKLTIAPHAVLGVDGNDITCKVPITICESILGAEIEVPTATGRVKMRIEPLSQPGRVYRLKGLGLAGGNQLVIIEVVVPNRLQPDEVVLYRKLNEISRDQGNPRAALFQAMQQNTIPPPTQD